MDSEVSLPLIRRHRPETQGMMGNLLTIISNLRHVGSGLFYICTPRIFPWLGGFQQLVLQCVLSLSFLAPQRLHLRSQLNKLQLLLPLGHCQDDVLATRCYTSVGSFFYPGSSW